MHALLGGVGYYRKFPRDLSKRIRPITSLLKKGVKFEFMPAMEVIVREFLAELAAPLILVFPDWDAVADGSHPFHVYCDASIRKLTVFSGPSNAFEATYGARSFASSRITRHSKALAKWEITMRESSGGSSFSPRSTTPSSTATGSPTEMPISCPICQSLPRNKTALALAASPP